MAQSSSFQPRAARASAAARPARQGSWVAATDIVSLLGNLTRAPRCPGKGKAAVHQEMPKALCEGPGLSGGPHIHGWYCWGGSGLKAPKSYTACPPPRFCDRFACTQGCQLRGQLNLVPRCSWSATRTMAGRYRIPTRQHRPVGQTDDIAIPDSDASR